ncbi:MAG TPA: hypothetical protein PKB07_05525, partial [Flavilitoribacter sp.]|nr:hypothetical protein [Flavilitoribacter sp.]
GLQPGIYHPAVRNADGSCYVEYLEPVALQSPEAPVIVAVQSSDLSDCNAADGTITIYSSSGSNYEFSLNGLEWSNSGIFTGLITGQYVPQIRNLDGSCRSVYPDTISLVNPFEAEIDSLILTPPSSCLTNNGEFLISGFNAATMAYSLDGGQTWKQDSVITGLGTGPISLEIRGVDYPGCKIEMDRFLGAGDFNLSELFFRIGDQQACLENDGSIEIQSHSVNDFQFSIDYGETWQSSGLFTALAPGSYQVLLRDSSLNCQVMLDTSFVVHALPTPVVQGITTLDAEDCGGNNGVVILETDNQDCVYSLDGGETWQTPTVFDALLPGTYILMARDTVSNCGIAYPDSITIRGIPLLTAQILEQSLPACADENNGYAIAGANGGIPPYVYTWSNSAGGAELNDLGPGTYSVTVVDSRQCRDSTAVVFDEMDDPFTGLPRLVRDTILCNGQSVRFDLSYLIHAEIEWHNRDGFHSTDPAIELERPGVYYLKILTSAGCRYLDTFEIRRINQDLIADFLLPAEAVIDEPVVAVDITWPLPDSIHWAYDQNKIQHLLSLPTQEFMRFTEPGTYSVFMDAYYGSCFDRLGKEIKVFGSRDSLSSNSQPGSSGLIAAFEIYPNPNDGRFSFKLVLTLPGSADIWLFRESGQLLEHRSVNGSQTYIEAFDRRGLLPGIYTMVAQAGSDWVFGNFVVN